MKAQKLDSKITGFKKDIRIAVLVLGTAILFFACKKNDIEKIQAFSSPENLPVHEAINFEMLQTDSGQVRFLMKTPQLLRYEIDGKFTHEFPKGIEIIEYDEQKNMTSSITADYAKEFIKEKKWEAKNNVVVTNAKGDTLKTEHLILDEKSGKIHTDEFVRIVGPDRDITGVGLRADQNMNNWEILKPRGPIYVTMDENNSQKKKQTPGAEIRTNNKNLPTQQTFEFQITLCIPIC